MTERENRLAIRDGLIILGMGALCTTMVVIHGREEISRVDGIKQEAISSPFCPSLQGEDWRVSLLGKNVLRVQDIVDPGGAPLLWRFTAAREKAELAGLREVLRRFENRVLNVAKAGNGLEHIVTVTDDTCPEG